jgi:hypothetical protein
MRAKRRKFKFSVFRKEEGKSEIVYIITRNPRIVANYLNAVAYSQIFEYPENTTFLKY